MNHWDCSPFTVTPAASLLSRCVASGVVSQEEIDSAFSEPGSAFSPHLHEAKEQIRMHKQLDELQLQLDLLKVDMHSSDVAHAFHLTRRSEGLQRLGAHLLAVLKEQKSLTQRLMAPLARTDLPVPAHLHRSVVVSFRMMMDFMERLEEKLRSVRNQEDCSNSLALLDVSTAQLLALAAETDVLSNRMLQWRTAGSCEEPPSPQSAD
uniref:HAUS augmin-like complex, subunit 2 n=1 Tax=Oryzias latipes TaxID=8090 RepID=A0A3P9IKW4_ORYLA